MPMPADHPLAATPCCGCLEFQLALMNRRLSRNVETVFMMTDYQWLYISSTIIKAVASQGGNIGGLVPENVRRALEKKYELC